jgi:hypothetical protein
MDQVGDPGMREADDIHLDPINGSEHGPFGLLVAPETEALPERLLQLGKNESLVLDAGGEQVDVHLEPVTVAQRQCRATDQGMFGKGRQA